MRAAGNHALSTSSAESLTSAFAGALAAGTRAPGSRKVPAPAGMKLFTPFACWTRARVRIPARAEVLRRKRSTGSSWAVALQARNHCSDTTLHPACAGVSCKPLYRTRKYSEGGDEQRRNSRTSALRRQRQPRAWRRWRHQRRCRRPSKESLASRDAGQRCVATPSELQNKPGGLCGERTSCR